LPQSTPIWICDSSVGHPVLGKQAGPGTGGGSVHCPFSQSMNGFSQVPLLVPYSQCNPFGEHDPLVGSVAGHPLLTPPSPFVPPSDPPPPSPPPFNAPSTTLPPHAAMPRMGIKTKKSDFMR
jgi:hypothetical protein